MFLPFFFFNALISLAKAADTQKDGIDPFASADSLNSDQAEYEKNEIDSDKEHELVYGEEPQAPGIPEIDETPDIETGINDENDPDFNNRFDKWNRQPNKPNVAWKLKKEEIWKKIKDIENRINQEEADEEDSELSKQIRKLEEELDKEKFILEQEIKISEYNKKEEERRERDRKEWEERNKELEEKEEERKREFERKAEERREYERKENEKRQSNEIINNEIKISNDDDNEKEQHFSHNMNKELEEPNIPDTPNEEKSKAEMSEGGEQTETPKLTISYQFVILIIVVAFFLKFSFKYIKRYIRKNFKHKRSDDLPL